MAEGLGDKVAAEVYVDSSAALSVTQRKGTGKMRHVRIGQLWVQEAAERGELSYRKIKGTNNPADLGTKHLAVKKIDELIPRISLSEADGRAEKSLHL